MSYHVTGAISAVIFLLTVSGLWSQLTLVWHRKTAFRAGAVGQRPTAILSLNQFVSSFLAFFSFFLYGACLHPFNHYLVWPRLIASLLTLAVLYEISIDRRDILSITAFAGCSALLLVMPLFLAVSESRLTLGRLFSQTFIVVVTAILAQGYAHQIVLIRRCGHTGAVSLRMHQFFLLKDLSTIAFACSMGLGNGWPVLLMSAVSAVTKLAIMWHFRWARISPVAERRRNLAAPTPQVVYAP